MRTPKAKPSQKFPAQTHTYTYARIQCACRRQPHTHTLAHKRHKNPFLSFEFLSDFQLLILFEALKRVQDRKREIEREGSRVSEGSVCLLQSFVQNYAAQTRTIHLQIEQFNLLPLCPTDIPFWCLKSCTAKVTTVEQKVGRGLARREAEREGGRKRRQCPHLAHTCPHTHTKTHPIALEPRLLYV